jgi:hypothetical protein
MTIRITGTLQPAGDFPVCLVENVQDAASEGYADGAAAAAVSAIPDASASAKGLATALQIAKLDDIPTDAQSAADVSAAVSAAVGAIPDATASNKGMATAAQIAKLNGISSGAINTGEVTVIADASASSAVAAIPDATTLARGMATAAQVSKLAGIPADAQSASQVTVAVNDVRYNAPRIYLTCAAVRADTSAHTYNPGVYVIGRGAFYWTSSSGTDSNDEFTDYIAASGGGFALSQDLYRDYTPMVNAPAYRAYRVYTSNNSLNLMTEFDDVTIQLGEENQVGAYNGETTTILNGRAVYASGPQGQRLKIMNAANGLDESMRIIGLATHNIDSHENGRITTFGLVRDINTNSFSAGADVYTSGTPGVLTATKPTGDVDGARVGIVMNSHPTSGAIFVTPEPIARLASATVNLPTSPRLGESYFDTTRLCWVVWNGSAWQLATRPGYADLVGDVNSAANVGGLTTEAYRDTPFLRPWFSRSADKSLSLSWQMPHDWQVTSPVEPHLHCVGVSPTTGNVRLTGKYTWARNGTLALNSWASWTTFDVTVEITAADQYYGKILSLGQITAPAGAQYPSAFLHIYVTRPGQSDALDTYDGSNPTGTAALNLMLEGVDCHVMRTGLGTAGLYS